jgi:hypothetical protein
MSSSPGKQSAIRKALLLALVSAGALGAILFVAWLAGGFARVGLDANITIALILGIVFSSLLGIALMALIFYSDRSGQDEEAQNRPRPEEAYPRPRPEEADRL